MSCCPSRLIERLSDPYREVGFVFPTEAGILLNLNKQCKRSFASVLKRAKLPHISFHDLRHTCATLLFPVQDS